MVLITAVLSSYTCTSAPLRLIFDSAMTAAMSRSSPVRSHASILMLTGYTWRAPVSHSTSTIRSTSVALRTLTQSARCTVTPLPRVT
jgi:hypothetical protein